MILGLKYWRPGVDDYAFIIGALKYGLTYVKEMHDDASLPIFNNMPAAAAVVEVKTNVENVLADVDDHENDMNDGSATKKQKKKREYPSEKQLEDRMTLLKNDLTSALHAPSDRDD